MSNHPTGRLVRLITSGMLLVLGFAGGAQAQEPSSAPQVIHLSVEGVVDPFMADHVEAEIAAAGDQGAAAVLLTIDTPGGLGSSMRQIVQAILNARVPVIGYVSPEGARAASAGAFILLACPVAAMAPGTNVGAATPVGVSGAVLTQKVTEDAVASIRSIAERRGRNADLAEDFVRDATSVTAQTALDQHVIDLIAPTTTDLLAAVDGRTVQVGAGRSVTLDTTGAELSDRHLSPGAAFLHALFDPTLAFIFFWLGLLLVVIELIVPHLGVSGVLGGSMLVAAFASFGMLPVRLIGVLLLVGSVMAFVLELHAPGIGVATATGAALLIAGGLFLYDGSVPDVRVSPLVLLAMAAIVTAFFTFAVRAALRLRHRPPVQGPDMILGMEGLALGGGLRPEGIVRAAAEEWKAVAAGGATIPGGARVRVTAIDGLRLTVEPVGDDGGHAPGGLPAAGLGERTTT
ncbi:MAG: nodulation protein NfeD [Actinomycetota bacterium]